MYTTIVSLAGDKPIEFKNSITIARAIKRKHPILSVNSNLPAKQRVDRIQYVPPLYRRYGQPSTLDGTLVPQGQAEMFTTVLVTTNDN